LALLATYFHACVFHSLFFDPEDECNYIFQKHWLTFSGLHDTTSQKLAFLITTAEPQILHTAYLTGNMNRPLEDLNIYGRIILKLIAGPVVPSTQHTVKAKVRLLLCLLN
jgi:hypothetical protein